jgi:hypothetical protein
VPEGKNGTGVVAGRQGPGYDLAREGNAVARRLLHVDRYRVELAMARLREGFAQALPLKPAPPRTRVRPCPHCQREIDASLSKCPFCLRLFRL